MIKGCLALGVIQSTHQFPDFILKATEHLSLRLPSRIIPHHGHEGPHHQGTHTGASNQCVAATSHVHDRGHGYSNSFNSTEVYILTHTMCSPPSLAGEIEWHNEAHMLHQSS